MKKSYKKPFTEVVKLNVGEMLQAVSGLNSSLGGTSTSGASALGKGDEDYDDLW